MQHMQYTHTHLGNNGESKTWSPGHILDIFSNYLLCFVPVITDQIYSGDVDCIGLTACLSQQEFSGILDE